MLSHPMPAISLTSFITFAPSDEAFFVDALITATSTYGNQEPFSGMSCFIIPPPVPFPTLITEENSLLAGAAARMLEN